MRTLWPTNLQFITELYTQLRVFPFCVCVRVHFRCFHFSSPLTLPNVFTLAPASIQLSDLITSIFHNLIFS
jgi:hypothetical protein